MLSQTVSNDFRMDVWKILISFLLVIVFYFMFGQESITKLKQKGRTISHYEADYQNIKSPGKVTR